MRETSQPIEVNIPAANYSPIPPADDIAQVFNIINNKGYIFPYTPRTLTSELQPLPHHLGLFAVLPIYDVTSLVPFTNSNITKHQYISTPTSKPGSTSQTSSSRPGQRTQKESIYHSTNRHGEKLVAWPPTRFLLSLWERYLEGEASEVEESDEEVEEEERMGDRRSSMASLVRFGKRIWRGEEAEEMGGERGREREREEGDGIQWTASEILSL